MYDIREVNTIEDLKLLRDDFAELYSLLSIAIYLDLLGGYTPLEYECFESIDNDINEVLNRNIPDLLKFKEE